MNEFFTALVPGLGTVALALLSGAGGAALLDLYYKPKRDRRKAAVLLYSEIILNADFCILHAHWRKHFPRQIPGDFTLSRLAFDAAIGGLSELPAPLVRKLVLLYNRVDLINKFVPMYSDAVDARDSLNPEDARRSSAERYCNTILDAFNTTIDKVFEESKEVLPELIALGKIVEKEDKAVESHQERVDQHFIEREKRLEALARARTGAPPAS